MSDSRRQRSTVTCPHCGGMFPFGRLACPHCGSDMETGWRGDDEPDTSLALPDSFGDDEYNRFVMELSGDRPEMSDGQRWMLFVGLVLVAALVFTLVL